MQAASAAFLALLTAACGGAHLYRAGDHSLASAAATSFASAKLTESARGEYAVLETLLVQELAATGRQIAAQRDASLRQVVGGTTAQASWQALDSAVTERLRVVAGGAAPAAALVTALRQVESFRDAIAQTADLYRIRRQPADPQPVCPARDTLAQPVTPDRQVLWEGVRAACDAYRRALLAAQRAVPPNTALDSVNRRIVDAERADSATQQQIAALTHDYQAARASYQAAVEQRDARAVASAATALRARLAALDPLTAGTSLVGGDSAESRRVAARIQALEAQQASLGRVLDALSDTSAKVGAPPPSGAAVDLAVLSWFPTLQSHVTAARVPAVSPLLLVSEHVRLQLDAARQRRANALARLDLLRREGDALATEAGALAGAQASLASVGPAAPNRNPDGSPCRTDRALADDFRRDGQACRERIVIALLRYANAWTTGELPRAAAQVRARALGHAAVVDASVNALAQWESLVKVPLDQLVAYHADGTRPQDVAALLSALGLGAVAATAHR